MRRRVRGGSWSAGGQKRGFGLLAKCGLGVYGLGSGFRVYGLGV